MESIKKMAEFTDILKEKNKLSYAYEFISDNYHKMDKTELAAIIRELLFGINNYLDDYRVMRLLEDVAVELDEQYDEAYQED